MSCAEFVGARVLAACGEAAGKDWSRHVLACEECSCAVADFQDVRRRYSQVRPVRLNTRTRRAILASIRRERLKSRLRSAAASLVGVAAAFLLFAGAGGAPTMVAAAEGLPKGSTIDHRLTEIQDRLDDLHPESRSYFDVNLDDLKRRVSSMTWDADSM